MDVITPETPLERRLEELSNLTKINDFYVTEDDDLAYKLNGRVYYDRMKPDYAQMLTLASKIRASGVKDGNPVIVQGDYSLSMLEHRYRVNILKTLGRSRWVLRLLPKYIPDPMEIGIPEHIVSMFQDMRNGLVLLVGVTGSGKCLALDTECLMHDGSKRKVQDIKVGDRLMGPDSKPRAVLSLTRGHGLMYRIDPVKGESWVCNDEHIMTLQHTCQEGSRQARRGARQAYGYTPDPSTPWSSTVDVRLCDLIARQQTRNISQYWKLFRTGVEFPLNPKAARLHPDYFYYVGLWLGDGYTRGNRILTGDSAIVGWVRDFSARAGYVFNARPSKGREHLTNVSARTPYSRNGRIRSRDLDAPFILEDGTVHMNTLLAECTSGLSKKRFSIRRAAGTFKSVPQWMLTASREQRLALLAGLLDTDGAQGCGGYDFINKNKQLSESVTFLARSLGMAAYLSPCEKADQNGTMGQYWRVSISGHTDMVPTVLSRKKCSARQQKKDALKTGWTATAIGAGDYYGFTLDGDGRFLLGDFTVTHNSTTIASLLNYRAARSQQHIITMEDPVEYIYDSTGGPSVFTQREVGQDVDSFSAGIRTCLRQSPDIVMVGEIRDAITAEAALQLSETGHIVVSTMHTSSVDQTVQRFMKLIPPERAEVAQSTLADVLRVVMCQTLVPTSDGMGRVAVHEIMVQTTAIQSQIRRAKYEQIQQEIETGTTRGQLNWERSIQRWVDLGRVDPDTLHNFKHASEKNVMIPSPALPVLDRQYEMPVWAKKDLDEALQLRRSKGIFGK